MPGESKGFAVGSPAPDFTIATASGEPFTLSRLRGAGNVVLVFLRGFR